MQHKNEKTEYLIEKFSSLIKVLRQDLAGKSLNTFAFENDISKGNLSRLEAGLNDPKLTTLWRIAEGLKMPLSELIKILEEELPEGWEILEN